VRHNRAAWTLAVIAGTFIGGDAVAAEADRRLTTPIVRRLIVSIPDRKLAVVENDRVVDVFTVAVGAPDTPSPVGTFAVSNRVSHPTYYHPGKVVPPGVHNPLGTRWIGLNHKGYGIHGTDDPASVGHARSHGCIRLRNADVERLFERVRSGDVVEMHAERLPIITGFLADAQ
jgi:lipoprotein-anchoring transpeptidase ErfK/SrfK